MTDLDIFSPYRRKTLQHEDRLTWGFLVALKYVPELQRFLRRLVLRRDPEIWPSTNEPAAAEEWKPASISTQTSQIGPEATRVVSVLLSDARLQRVVKTAGIERTARYDGVVEFPDGLVFIVENKPHSTDVWDRQLSPSLESLHDLPEGSVYEEAISLEWPEVLEGILRYTASPLVAYPERTIASDFLSFAQGLHPYLSPYRTFELCGGEAEALSRRVKALLEDLAEATGLEVGMRPGGESYLHLPGIAVRQLYFDARAITGEGLIFRQRIWPGDTVVQARAFFRSADRDAFLSLEERGWQIQPNFHFSHIQRHFVWADTGASLSHYFDHFVKNPDEIGQKQFDEVPIATMWERWLELGLISPQNVDELRQHFAETNRGYINVIPGFKLSRSWPMMKIIEMETDGSLEDELLSELSVALATWGEKIPERGSM